MPPMVARDAVETSTGNHRPWAFSWRLRSSSTMPGSTRARRPATSRSRMRVEMLRAVDDDRMVDGLAGLRRAAAARRHRHALGAADLDRPFRLLHRARHHHAERHDLVVRGVGGVAAAREAVEMHAARDLGLQPPLQSGQQRAPRRLIAAQAHPARGLDQHVELAPLDVFVEPGVRRGAGEAAIGADAEVLHRHELRCGFELSRTSSSTVSTFGSRMLISPSEMVLCLGTSRSEFERAGAAGILDQEGIGLETFDDACRLSAPRRSSRRRRAAPCGPRI